MKHTKRNRPVITTSHTGWLLCLLLASALSAGCRKPAEPEKKQASAVSVRVAHAEKKTLRPSFQVIGTVLASPDRQATLAAATPGLVESLVVQEGAKGRHGVQLDRLPERPLHHRRDRAQPLPGSRRSRLASRGKISLRGPRRDLRKPRGRSRPIHTHERAVDGAGYIK